MKLERITDVVRRTGLTRSQVYKLMTAGYFPRPCSISAKGRAWVTSEVDEWISARIGERDAALKDKSTS